MFQAADAVPIGVVILLLTVLLLGAVELGYRVGRYRRRMPDREAESPSGAMVGATLGLLAFMLAFTFGMAATRFDARKRLVLDEANAIGTAYLRAQLIPEPHAAEARGLLRAYVDARLVHARTPDDVAEARTEERVLAAVAESERIHGRLWTGVATMGEADPRSTVLALYAGAINEVIDLHSERIAMGIRNRIPPVIWIALGIFSVLSMVGLGAHAGLASPRRSVGSLLVTLAFVAVLSLIVDLDRGQEGFLRVGQDALFDVRASMDAAD